MGYGYYASDVNSNSLQDSINVLITDENKSGGYNIAKFSYRNLRKEKPSDVLIKIENKFESFKVLSIEPYYVWLGFVVNVEGVVHSLAVKIKDHNFFELMKDSIIEYGTMKINSVIIFYRGTEVYISPEDIESTIYKKALNLKKSTEVSEKIPDPKKNYVYRTKNGLLAIHLGTFNKPSFDFKTLLNVQMRELYVLSLTKTDKKDNIRKNSIETGKKKTLIKNPYIEDLGENMVDNVDTDLMLKNTINYETEDKKKDDAYVGSCLVKEEMLHYIESLPKDNFENNAKRLIDECFNFGVKYAGENLSKFKGAELGKALIVQAAFLQQYANSTTEGTEDALEFTRDTISNLLFEGVDNEVHMPNYYENKLDFKLSNQVKDFNSSYSMNYTGSYKIKDSTFSMAERTYHGHNIKSFIKDLLKMKQNGILK